MWHHGINRRQTTSQSGEQDKGVCHFIRSIKQKEVHSLSLAQTLTLPAALSPNRTTSVFTHTVLSNVYCTKLPHVLYTIFAEIKISWIVRLCPPKDITPSNLTKKTFANFKALWLRQCTIKVSYPLSTFDGIHVRKNTRLSLPAQLQCLCSEAREPGNEASLLNIAWWIEVVSDCCPSEFQHGREINPSGWQSDTPDNFNVHVLKRGSHQGDNQTPWTTLMSMFWSKGAIRVTIRHPGQL